MKEHLRKIEILNYTNSKIKAVLQEKCARNSLRCYRKKAKKQNVTVLKKNELSNALHKRLHLRGVYPEPKSKGNLHIFLTFPLSNWEYILPIALRPFGKVTSFEWRSLGFDNFSKNRLEIRDDMNNKMLGEIKEAHSTGSIDALIGYFSDNTVSPQILKQISDMGIIIFNFSFDDKLLFRNLVNIASSIDLNLTNAPDSCIKYIAEGGLSMFWPQGAHPDDHKPYDLPFEFDVSFVGGKYGWRPKFIKRLQRRGINVECFGNGWGNGSLSDEEMVKLYSRSRITLGFAGVGHSRKLMCLKGRDFEVPMSGGLYLTQNNPELSLVYDVGKEIVTYCDEKYCVEKIRWLLGNPEEADKIREAGRMRALRDHTWEKRFEEVFEAIGLVSKGM